MSGKIEIFGMTHVGQEREHNEDNFVICQDVAAQAWQYRRDERLDLGPLGALLAVADGMGGTNAGEVASDIAQRTVREAFAGMAALPANIPAFLQQTILRAHHAIVGHAQKHPECAGMGTTLVLAWLIGNDLYSAWSGDSRCYLFRPGTGLMQVSEDHSMVWEMVKAGKLSAEDAWDHPESNIITQSLGDPGHPPQPSATHQIAQAGDRILVCSDGLNGMLRDRDIARAMGEPLDTAATCQVLVERANAAGGHDNITVLLLDAHELPPPPANGGGGMGHTTMRKTLKVQQILIGVLVLVVLGLVAFSMRDTIGGLFGMPAGDSLAIEGKTPTPGAVPIDDTSVPAADPTQEGGQQRLPTNGNARQNPGNQPGTSPTDDDDAETQYPIDSIGHTPPVSGSGGSGILDSITHKPADTAKAGTAAKVPTQIESTWSVQQFNDAYQKIATQYKVPAGTTMDCMLKEGAKKLSEADKANLDIMVQQRKAKETEMTQWLEFDDKGKVVKLKKNTPSDLLHLKNLLTGDWLRFYQGIFTKTAAIRKRYETESAFKSCAKL
jgi:protein phosphatase